MATSLADNLEAMDLGLVVINLGWQDHSLRVVLKEVVWKRCSKEGSVDIDRSELRDVHLLASWAVNFKSGHLQAVAEAHWQNLLPITKCARAMSVKPLEELVVNLG